MPRIRKKTSNRASTNDRAKLRHKIVEGRKKNRKLAKKNPQWKSRVPKDPGIPNSMPFKDQVLAEVAAERRRAEEEKQLRKAAKKTAPQTAKGDDSESEVDESRIGMDGVTSLLVPAKTAPTVKTPKVSQPIEVAVVDEPEPLLFDPSIPDLKHALDKADIWLYVLDARDPLTHRSSFIENLVRERGKKLVFLLNKIDLSPQESLRAWLVQLRALHPTFPFRVSSALLPPVDDDVKGKTKVSETDGLGTEALVQHLEQLSSSGESPVTIAVIGMPNSGKSAVINTICGFSRLATYKPDLLKSSTVTTTLPQPVDYDTPSGSKLRFIDTPGFDLLLPPLGDIEKYTMQGIDSLVRSRGRIEKMKLPELAAKWIVSRAKQEDLMLHYSTPAYLASDPLSFLSGHARVTGRLKKGGVLDITDSARSILRDWRVGKFPYYTSPPGPANIEGLSAEDEKVLGNVRSRREMRAHPGLIRLSSGTVDSRSVVLDGPPPAPARSVEPLVPVNPTRTTRSLADAEASDEEAETSSDDEESHNERGAESKPVNPASSKRKRSAAKTEGGRPAKKVTFASKKSDRAAVAAAKVVPRTVSNVGKGAPKVAAASGDSDAYDFGQYF